MLTLSRTRLFFPTRGASGSRLVLILACLFVPGVGADEPASRFTGPPREAPRRDFDLRHLKLECEFDWTEESVSATATLHLASFRDGPTAVALDAVELDVLTVTDGEGRALDFESRSDGLRVDVGRAVRRDEEVVLVVRYRARPERGLYFQKPGPQTPQAPKQLWTQGETHEARHWIPCIDHPVERFTTEILVTAPAGLTALSNGKLVSASDGVDGRRVFHWHQDKPHAAYLICVVVGDFSVWESSAEGVALTGYLDARYAEHAERTFGLTADMLRFFNTKLGYRYPWDKYAQVCVHGFHWGGMENTTLTVLTERTIRDERAALDGSSRDLVAHELAHHWFGDLVTCKDWGEIWLNESFATYYANRYLEHHLGWDEAVVDRLDHARSYLGEARERYRRRLASRNYSRAEDMFDAHSYPKGALVLNMLRYVLGEESFDRGIQHYLKTNAFRAVETADLRVAMEEVTGESLRWFFDQWVHSGGHPEFRVETEWDETSKGLRIVVEQVQKVDEMTPLFQMPVVFSLHGKQSRTERRVWVRDAKSSFFFSLPERPAFVRFDPGDWLLKELTFKKGREPLLAQLRYDPDVIGRLRAARDLADSITHKSVLKTLGEKLETEPFWAVRGRIARTLGESDDPAAVALLVARLGREGKSDVRRDLVRALGQTKAPQNAADSEVIRTLRQVVAKDDSYSVVAAALGALAELLKSEARADLVAALKRPSHREAIRRAAVRRLAGIKKWSDDERAELVRLFLPLTAPEQDAGLRSAAYSGLARVGKGDDAVFEALKNALETPLPWLRVQVIGALAELFDERAVEVLTKRRRLEGVHGPMRPRDAIDRALRKLRGEPELEKLQGQFDRLEKSYKYLEERLKVLEEPQARS